MSYGAIAEYVGHGGPRQVGTVMARYGGGVPWHRVVTATGHPHADETFAHVEQQLDRYAHAWTSMRTEACLATRVRGGVATLESIAHGTS